MLASCNCHLRAHLPWVIAKKRANISAYYQLKTGVCVVPISASGSRSAANWQKRNLELAQPEAAEHTLSSPPLTAGNRSAQHRNSRSKAGGTSIPVQYTNSTKGKAGVRSRQVGSTNEHWPSGIKQKFPYVKVQRETPTRPGPARLARVGHACRRRLSSFPRQPDLV